MEERYDPEEDELYQAGIFIFGYPTLAELYFYSDFIEEQSRDNNIDPSLIKGIILNEAITSYGAGILEAIGSGVNDIFGGFGTYGPAQLGPVARTQADLNIIESLTTPGAIIGAANFLSAEKERLIKEVIKNPTNGQIATRYNQGSWDSSKPITKYGVRVEYLVDRFYNQ